MRDALRHIPTLIRRIKQNGFIVMLDFDGVLAPIVARPESAHMSDRTRRLLAACAHRGRVAVISGRALADVRKRVGLRGVWYAGNHGAEWLMGSARGHERPRGAAAAALRDARSAFVELAGRYPGVVEDKKITFSVHFRGLARAHGQQFKKDAAHIAKQFSDLLEVAEGREYIFNVRARASRTKGDAARLALKLAPSGTVPLYIGDDTTDEDAFRALPRGVTIRVGIRRGSRARFFLRTRADVDVLLAALAEL